MSIDFFAGVLLAALVCWAWAQRLLRRPLPAPPPDVLVEVFARCPCARMMIVKARAPQLVRLQEWAGGPVDLPPVGDCPDCGERRALWLSLRKDG